MPLAQSRQCAWLALLKLVWPYRPALHSVHLLFQLIGPLFQLPSAHATQDPEFERPHPLRMVPPAHGAHGLHLDWPASLWYSPLLQLMQLAWPAVPVNLPLSQFEHVSSHCPEEALNMPALHAEHDPAFSSPHPVRKYPAPHASHDLQCARPVRSWYVPSAQVMQSASQLAP